MPAQPPFAVGFDNTPLNNLDELAFRAWLARNKVPFNPDANLSDYDMRGFWRAQQQRNPKATSGINANDGMMHYPDYWKTPLHQSMSAESQWAGPNAPSWINDHQLVAPNGRVVFDEIKRGLLGLLGQ